jgi:hypothetical protein
MPRAEMRRYKKLDPAYGMPAAFVDFIRAFPCPPAWHVHPGHDDAALEMVVVATHRPAVLPLVVANVCGILPGAALTVVHGKENGQWVKDEVLRGWDPAVHPGVRALEVPDVISSASDYSLFMLQPSFWSLFRSRRILIFQPDVVLLRNTVLDFIHETYVGAPWRAPVLPNVYVGNGGLSLRCPRTMRRLCESGKAQELAAKGWPEDVIFSSLLAGARPGTPSPLRAQRFCAETHAFAIPMGVHKPWSYVPAFKLKEMLTCAPLPPRPDHPLPRVWERDWALFKGDRQLAIELSPSERGALTSWIRLGTNHRGFFCDEAALVPLPSRLIDVTGDPSLCAYVLACEEGPVEIRLSSTGMCMSRVWFS